MNWITRWKKIGIKVKQIFKKPTKDILLILLLSILPTIILTHKKKNLLLLILNQQFGLSPNQ